MSYLGYTPDKIWPLAYCHALLHSGPALHVSSRPVQLHNWHVNMQEEMTRHKQVKLIAGICREDPQYVI